MRPARTRSSGLALPEIGERNVALFKMLKDMAFTAARSDELSAIAQDLNSQLPHSLPINGIEKMVKQIWRYKQEGLLLPSGKQVILLPLGKDQIIDMSATPEALTLLTVLKATRAQPIFTIPQQATAKRLGWPAPNDCSLSIMCSYREMGRLGGP